MENLTKALKDVKREMKHQQREMKTLKRKAAGIASQFAELLNEHRANIDRDAREAKRARPLRPVRPHVKKTNADMSNLLKKMKM